MIDDTETRQQDETAPPADNDFSAAFRERNAEQGGETRTEPAEEGSEARKAEEETREAPPPAPAPPAAEAPADGSSDPPNAAGPWDGLKPEQLERIKRIETSERSQRGRLGALARKNAKLETELEGLKQAPKTVDGGEGGPETAETLDAKLAKVSAAAADYPESIGPVAEALAELRKQVETLSASNNRMQEQADEQETAASYEALAESHPDYAELAGDKAFLSWVGDQPEAVVKLANSWNPREVSVVLSLFKAEKATSSPPPPPSPTPPAAEEKKGTDNNLDAKRQRQLDGSKEVASRGAAVAGVPDDFSSAFKARMAKHEKEDAA